MDNNLTWGKFRDIIRHMNNENQPKWLEFLFSKQQETSGTEDNIPEEESRAEDVGRGLSETEKESRDDISYKLPGRFLKY